MKVITQEKVLQALKQVKDPILNKSIAESGRLSEIFIKDSKVIFSITTDSEHMEEFRQMQVNIKDIIENLDGVDSALITLTAKRDSDKQAPSFKEEEFDGTKKIKHIILVASGKGGVGKSTVACNLAMTFAQQGFKTGLFDADIYGSSQPRMTGVYEKPKVSTTNIIEPPIAHDLVKFMSIGLFVNGEEPVVWRGPRIHSALNQMLKGVNWGELDILVIDMPPGTGDVQLSIANLLNISGAVIVSTPQQVALTEARKGIAMFSKVNIPTLGIIENMSYYLCPNCNHRDDVFDSGKAQQTSREMSVEFLGEIPLNSKMRIACDKGIPFVVEYKDDGISKIYNNMAKHISVILSIGKSCKYSKKV